MADLSKFERGLEAIGISLTERQKDQFLQYYELLVEKIRS